MMIQPADNQSYLGSTFIKNNLYVNDFSKLLQKEHRILIRPMINAIHFTINIANTFYIKEN